MTTTGEYTINMQSELDGRYGLVVTENVVFDSEPNDSTTGLRQISAIQGRAVGHLEGEGQRDSFEIELTDGQAVRVSTLTPIDATGSSPGSTLNPAIRILSSVGEELAADTDSNGGKNASLVFAPPSPGTYVVEVSAETGKGEYVLEAQPASGTFVAGRHLFYNNSKYDIQNAGHDAADDASIADKSALRPGQTASWQNYTNYGRGINGIMVDVMNLRRPSNLRPTDFQFSVGNNDNPESWRTVVVEPTISVRTGQGTAGSDRITITWPDGLIVGEWLRVEVLATPRTGLATADVHYWGSAPGDTGNNATNAFVDGSDFATIRDASATFADPAPLNSNIDMNRDSFVDATDLSIVRDYATNFLSALQLITAPISAQVQNVGAQLSVFDIQVQTSNYPIAETIESAPELERLETQVSRRVDQVFSTIPTTLTELEAGDVDHGEDEEVQPEDEIFSEIDFLTPRRGRGFFLA